MSYFFIFYLEKRDIKQIMFKNTSVFLNKAQENEILVDYYDQLSQIVHLIERLLREFSRGEFEVLVEVFTSDVYDRLAQDLYELQRDPSRYPEYEILRKSATHSLEGLQQGLLQYGLLKNTQAELAIARKAEEILHNTEKLKEYIQSILGSRSIFSKKNVKTIRAEMKPEYTEYVRLFGFPRGCVFEMDKLAIARSNIGLAGCSASSSYSVDISGNNCSSCSLDISGNGGCS
jgi:hypothetical protein